MMRTFLVFLALCCAASHASAQVFAVHLKDEKSANKYKRNLIEIDGRQVLVGEGRSGITYDPEKRNITYPPEGRFELFVADQDDPSEVAYRLEDGERVTRNRKLVLPVQGSHVERVTVLMEHQSLMGLAAEYRERQSQVADQEQLRDAHEQGTPAWFAHHRRMVAAQERLRSWLASTTFPSAAAKLATEIERQRKIVEADAVSARLATAVKAIRVVPVPERLVQASQDITGGTAKFRVMESQHIRITCLEEVSEARVRGLLELGERVIAGFRADCIDPYLHEGLEDKVPDALFSEFWFGPEERSHHERFYVDYYGQRWGDRKEERLNSSGSRTHLFGAPEHLDYFKLTENSDLEGVLTHGLGHHLVSVHYNMNRRGFEQDWLSEGCALYLSLEYLGRNSVTCKAFAPPSRYVHEKGKEGEKTLQVGLRAYFNQLALEKGPPLDRLAVKKLFEMEDGDLAKSWSLYDYIVRKEGRRGQEFLRAGCQHSTAGKEFIARWRTATEELWGVKGQDVFRLIDESWRTFASSTQDTGDTDRRR